MRLDKIDMERIYEHQPMYIRFFNLKSDEITDEEWNNFIAMPMLVKKIFVSGDQEFIEQAKLQYPVCLQESPGMYMGRRNKYIVEMDITSKCNLACPNCVRFSQLTDTWVSLTMSDVNRFVSQNIHKGKNLTVKVIGGEPLVHPDIIKILHTLNAHFHVMLATNGIMEWTPPFPMTIEDSAKEKSVLPEFHATCDAPIDDAKYDYDDFSFGCDTANVCEDVYTVDGYFPCTVAGSIDRMLRLPGGPREKMESLGVDDLNECNTPFNRKKVFNSLCGMCGFYKKMGYHEAKNTETVRTTEQVYSKSWKFMEGIK